jgi:hypothetical protein
MLSGPPPTFHETRGGTPLKQYIERLTKGRRPYRRAEFVGTFIHVFTVFAVIHRRAAPGFAGVAWAQLPVYLAVPSTATTPTSTAA